MNLLRVELLQERAIGAGDHQNDRRGHGGFELVENAKAVDVRHQKIEQNDRVAVLSQQNESFTAVSGFIDCKIAPAENGSQKLANRSIVIDDEDTFGGRHQSTPSRKGPTGSKSTGTPAAAASAAFKSAGILS